MLRFLTGGESHGKCLAAILEGMVAGVGVSETAINRDLERRQQGYGRGGRMTIEKDEVEILSGVRRGQTIGGPITLVVRNVDSKIDELPVIQCPRPGHADLSGVLKYARNDARDILERASARETAARVAVGAVCRMFLGEFGVETVSHVVCLGGVRANVSALGFDAIKHAAEYSPTRSADKRAEKKMMARIDGAKRGKDTLGGIFEILVRGVPAGLGSFVQYDRRLTGILAGALMSIPSVKGVEIGAGFALGSISGRQTHDEIYYDRRKGFYRKTNRAGGIEGGMTNGEMIVLRAAVKPISTLLEPMRSVRLDSKASAVATVERSDITVVPAAGVVGESMVLFELAKSFLEKFGGDSLGETRRNYLGYLKQLSKF